MNDERLMQAWRAHSDPATAAAPPTIEECEALLDGRLEPARREALLTRVAEDAAAAQVLQLAMDVRAAAQAAVATRAPSRSIVRSPMRWVQALAACLLVAVGAAIWLRPLPVDEVLRGAATSATTEPADGALLTAVPTRLRWTAQPGIARYVVRLYDARAELLWQSDPVTQSELPMDANIRQRMGNGHYYWRVEWSGAEGAGLGPYRFEVKP